MKNRSSHNERDRSTDVEERVSLTSAAIDDIDREDDSFREGKRVVLKKEDGGKELKTLKSLEEDEIDFEFEKWADDLSIRQRKRKDRRKTLQTIALMVGVGLVVCGISFAVMIPVITHHKSHHNADNTNSILSLCEQKQYDQWCQGQVESAGNEWQALKDKYNDGTLTLDLLIGHLDTALYYLRPAMDLSELYESVAVTEACRSSASQCSKLASSQNLKGYSDPVILKAIHEIVEGLTMSTEEEKLINDTIRIFHNSGAGLDESQREAFVNANSNESKYADAFNSALDSDERYVSRPADDSMALEGLSPEFLEEHTKDGIVTFGTVYSDLDFVLDFAVNETLRKDLLIQYLRRGTPENLVSLQSLISVRQEIAKAVNKTSWAELKSDGLMLHDVNEIQDFLENTYNAVVDHTSTYQQSLLQLKGSSASTGQVLDSSTLWQYDRDFWKGALQENLFNYSEGGLSQYLEYEKVKGALFGVFEDVFGVQFNAAPNEYKWDPSVEVYSANNASTSELMGYLYLDLWPRENKYKHSAHFSITEGLMEWTTPFERAESVHRAAVVCNFPQPPDTMLFSDVVTFFHESGHFLHGLMASQNQRYALFSGIQTEFDFVEAPSQFLESYAYDNRTLNAIDPNIPQHYVSSSLDVDRLGRAQAWQQQVFYSQISWVLHKDVTVSNTTETVIDLQAKYSPFPYIPETYFQAGFGHLTGYSSNYFVYLWSKAMALQIYDQFISSTAEGLYNVETATFYRDVVLRPGGTQKANDYMTAFLGHPPAADPFFKWLQEPVSKH